PPLDRDGALDGLMQGSPRELLRLGQVHNAGEALAASKSLATGGAASLRVRPSGLEHQTADGAWSLCRHWQDMAGDGDTARLDQVACGPSQGGDGTCAHCPDGNRA